MDKTAKRLIARNCIKGVGNTDGRLRVCGNGHFCFSFFDGKVHYIARGGDKYWSQVRPLTEDNLRYLLAEISKNRP